jgi:hypothetical protein
MDTETARAKEKMHAALHGASWVIMIVIFAVLALAVISTSDSHELTPAHPENAIWACTIAVGAGLLTLILAIGKRPWTFRRLLNAVVPALMVAFVGFPVGGILLYRVHDFVDFSGLPIVQSTQDFPIRRASITHGRSDSYWISLTDYPVTLAIAPQDYLAAFGTAERVHPMGYCVRAIMQSTARASRVLVQHGIRLPPGSLRPCP